MHVVKIATHFHELAILYLDLCCCETWSLAIREAYRLRMFEKRVVRRISGPKREEVTEEWRKLHSEELHNLY
jgi:hypothetical protein